MTTYKKKPPICFDGKEIPSVDGYNDAEKYLDMLESQYEKGNKSAAISLPVLLLSEKDNNVWYVIYFLREEEKDKTFTYYWMADPWRVWWDKIPRSRRSYIHPPLEYPKRERLTSMAPPPPKKLKYGRGV